MKDGVAFIAFSLNDKEDVLDISMRTGSGVALNRIVETSMPDLALLNARGLDDTAAAIGRFVLSVLQIQHRDRFKAFPNLHVPASAHPPDEPLPQPGKEGPTRS